ncbi:MAG: hypothetical protein KC776_19520 [Myxococcales bacterium]|nr:hypothetical protein [Myxococcales bacterium]
MGGGSNWLEDVMRPTENDSADVRWAVETATALWHRGDREQSVSWMHHAVQAATADGQHARADELDRAAQELETRPVPRAPSRPPPSPGVGLPTARSPEEVTGSMRHHARTAPYKVAPDDITHLEAPDSALLEAAAQSIPASSDTGPTEPINEVPQPKPERPRPPVSSDWLEPTVVNAGVKRPVERTMVMDVNAMMREAERAKAPVVTTPDAGEDEPESRDTDHGSSAGVPSERAEPPSVLTSARSPSSLPKVLTRPPSQPDTLGSPHGPLEPMHAVRVAVARGSGKELAVRLLGPDEAAPEGTQEALLLALGKG